MGHVLKTTTSLVATACGAIESGHLTLQYFTAEWEPAFLRQASEFPFSTEELGPSPRGSDPVSCRLT